MDAHGLQVRILITDGTTHDATQADALIDKLPAEYIFADKAYDGNAIRDKIVSQSAIAVIPSKSNRKYKIPHDHSLYKIRHLVENAFLHLKQWRGIATRYAKNTASFLAAVQIRAMVLWGK